MTASTQPLPDGQTVSPQQYLADSAAAAAAVGDFTDLVTRLGPVPTKERIRAEADALAAASDAAAARITRIGAERLDDARLEEQRARAASALEDVEVAMQVLADRARHGTPAGVAAAARDYADAVAGLKGIATDS